MILGYSEVAAEPRKGVTWSSAHLVLADQQYSILRAENLPLET